MKHTTRIVVAVTLGLALGACGGSGDDERPAEPPTGGLSPEQIDAIIAPAFEPGARVIDPEETVPAVPPGRIEGRVVDAVDGLGLGGASVVLGRADPSGSVSSVARTTSLPNGRYVFTGLPLDSGPLVVDIALAGFASERVESVRASVIDGTSLERVRLVPVEQVGTGSLAGRLVDADGEPLAGTTLEFVRGIGRTRGEGATVVATDADGRWSVAGLAYGNWTCLIYGPDGTVTTATVTVATPERSGLEAVALPALAENERLVVVTRGDWFQAMWTEFEAPDDDVDAAAVAAPLSRWIATEPDGTQITRVTLSSGTLRLWALKHPIANGFADFEVTVRVIGPDGVVATFTEGREFGVAWVVFDMDLESGELFAGGRRP